MLVLTRKVGQKIMIGDDIEIKVQRLRGNTVRLAITAPKSAHIVRAELGPKEGGK